MNCNFTIYTFSLLINLAGIVTPGSVFSQDLVSKQAEAFLVKDTHKPISPEVTYQSFYAIAGNQKITLNWFTQSEINLNHFEVERSLDNIHYTTIGLVLDGFPNGETGKRYQFKDLSYTISGYRHLYYRLKEKDAAGNVAYSKVVTVVTQAEGETQKKVSRSLIRKFPGIRYSSYGYGTAEKGAMCQSGQTRFSKPAIVSKGNLHTPNRVQVFSQQKATARC